MTSTPKQTSTTPLSRTQKPTLATFLSGCKIPVRSMHLPRTKPNLRPIGCKISAPVHSMTPLLSMKTRTKTASRTGCRASVSKKKTLSTTNPPPLPKTTMSPTGCRASVSKKKTPSTTNPSPLPKTTMSPTGCEVLRSKKPATLTKLRSMRATMKKSPRGCATMPPPPRSKKSKKNRSSWQTTPTTILTIYLVTTRMTWTSCSPRASHPLLLILKICSVKRISTSKKKTTSICWAN